MGAEEEYTGGERRKGVRWKHFIPAKYSLVNGDKETVLKGMQNANIYNISSMGACLEVTQPDDKIKYDLMSGKMKVFLEIELPGGKEPILALTKVIWLSKLWKEKWEPEGGYLIGLNFVDITTSSRDAIRDYILKQYAQDSKKEGA